MPGTISQQTPDDRPDGQLRRPPEGELAVSLWLVAVVIAEAELFLWVLERVYS